jgi:hypothetical protein
VSGVVFGAWLWLHVRTVDVFVCQFVHVKFLCVCVHAVSVRVCTPCLCVRTMCRCAIVHRIADRSVHTTCRHFTYPRLTTSQRGVSVCGTSCSFGVLTRLPPPHVLFSPGRVCSVGGDSPESRCRVARGVIVLLGQLHGRCVVVHTHTHTHARARAHTHTHTHTWFLAHSVPHLL